MRRFVLAGSCCSALVLAPHLAQACGAAYGAAQQIKPDQVVVVSHLAGVERYEFNPAFCGSGGDFGLFLPIPAPLSGKVELAPASLRIELDDLTKPELVTERRPYCPSGGRELGATPRSGGSDAAVGGANNGVDVVDAGQVSFLDYEVLKADSEDALTSFLDANKYPYDAKARGAFAHYVSKGWYFVAFKVTATADPVQRSKQICGSIGPLAVTFATPEPVVPVRIVTDDAPHRWRLYTLSEQNRGPSAPGIAAPLFFAGALTETMLATRPALRALAAPEVRLTRHDISFRGADFTDDLRLLPTATPTTEFHTVERRVEDVADDGECVLGCSAADVPGAPREGLLGALFVGLAALLARRRATA